MKYRKILLRVGLTTTLIAGSAGILPTAAASTSAPPALQAPPGLAIAQIKMTGDEFVVLQNNTAAAITDLSSYWLYAFNKTSPALAGATSSGQQLPVGQLDPGQAIRLSDKGGATCGAQITGNLTLSFGDSNGYLSVVKQTADGSALTQTPGDHVAWGTDTSIKPSTVGDIAKVPANTTEPLGMYYRTATGWQLADLDAATACQLNVTAVTGTPPVAVSTAPAKPGTPPPATIVSVASAEPDSTTLPADNTGLSAPQITELLPNPTGTGNDDTDEFIELYNPNDTEFHLVGYALQTGTTTKHKYVFPDGTVLPPKSFTAFNSANTGLSLSNTSGQAELLDPAGASLGVTSQYDTAKDGLTWALADNKWYWTAVATPNAANVIQQASTQSKIKSTTKTSSSSAVKGASTSASGTANAAKTTEAAATGNAADAQKAPIHPYILAAIGALAVGYGVYEYRHDLGNRLHELRRNRAARRAARPQAAG